MIEDEKHLYHASGEHPPDLETIPGEVAIDPFPSPSRLNQKAEEFLEKNPDVLQTAQDTGKDVVAVSTSRGKSLFLIAGGASLVTAGLIGGIVLYRHVKKKGLESKE